MKQADAEPAEAENVVTFPTPVRIKNPAAVALGKLGGSKGGQKRAENLSPERRREIAQRAAQARWAKAKKVMPVEADTSTGGGSTG